MKLSKDAEKYRAPSPFSVPIFPRNYTVISGDINAAEGATLSVDGKVLIEHYHAGDLGVTLSDAAVPQDIQTTYTAVGDPLFHSATIAPGGKPAEWHVTNTYNWNYKKNPDGTQTLVSYDVDYYLIDPANGNSIEGGGPERADAVRGTSANDERLYGGSQVTTAVGIANCNTDTATGLKEDFLAGSLGDDVLIAGSGINLSGSIAANDACYTPSFGRRAA